MSNDVQAWTETEPRPASSGPRAAPAGAPGATAGVRTERARVTPELTGTALTVLQPIVPEREAELVRLLDHLGQSIGDTPELPLDALSTVHFCRWVVIPATASAPPQLAFESNYDGTLDEHLADLFQHCAEGLHQIYRCCAGYPFAQAASLSAADAAPAQAYLKQGMLRAEAFYVGRCGKSARRIRTEGKLRDAIQLFLDRQGYDPMRSFGNDPATAYAAIVAHLEATEPEAWQELHEPAAAPPVRSVLPLLWRGLFVVPPLLLAFPVLYPILRYKEETDRAETYAVLPEQTRELAEREDFQVQNQLTHLVAVKPGPFRLFALRTVLFVIDQLARYWFNQGDLDGLNTIHYARWVLIDGGKRLLFFSNYDGSWERYLGDFVDQEHLGLTSVWSNTEGYPKSQNLLWEGATDEERFKAWTRAHQLPTQLWYSAYKQLTTPNIGRNSRICAGLLQKPATRRALEEWLMLL